MTNQKLPIQSAFKARSFAVKKLEVWSQDGASQKDELERIVTGIRESFNKRTSLSQTLNAAMKKLQGFFSKREVWGEVQRISKRHIEYRLAFLTTSQEEVIFCLVCGEINVRTGSFRFELTKPIQLSLHALERLFERLNDHSGSAVLDEIYSCIGLAIPWHKAATEIKAKCWPVMSQHGFFIGYVREDTFIPSIITWYKFENMSKKWDLPISNLTRLKNRRPALLEDQEFAQEFLRSFPWMLHEHVPGENLIDQAWNRPDDEEVDCSEHDESWEHKQHGDDLRSLEFPSKLSVSYIVGFNYCDTPPPFLKHTQHEGVVVQSSAGGHLIVGLKNGWVGKVPRRSIDRGLILIPGYVAPEIGDVIDVVIHKITHNLDEGAYVISLDTKDVYVANWIEIEKDHPVGTVVIVEILNFYNKELVTVLDSGIRGVVPVSDVKSYLAMPKLFGGSLLGRRLEVTVIGYRPETKCLLFSFRGIESIRQQSHNIPYKTGDEVRGKCIGKDFSCALIRLPEGMLGLLNNLNNWGKELPKIGDIVQAVFIDVDASTSLIQLAGPRPESLNRVFYAMPEYAERWETFTQNHTVGDTVELQVLWWNESLCLYTVATSTGVVGNIPAIEIDWLSTSIGEQKYLLNPGDIINAMILKINLKKNYAVFSKKALEKHPLAEHISQPITGKVMSVVDYGCFVQLQPYNIQGLLHRSKIPEGTSLTKGDTLTVYVESIDHTKTRVTLSLVQQS